MKSRWLTLPLAVLLALPLVLLASCGDDDDDNNNGGTQPEVTDVPQIPAAEIETDVTFNSQDPNAQNAEYFVEGQLAMAQAFTSLGQAYLAPLDGADWSSGSGDCYSYSYTYAACTYTYEVCETNDGYTWTATFNGDCGGQIPYVNWVAMRGTTNDDGTEGSWRLYEENSTTVMAAWAWSMADDGKSGSWTFYDGDIGSTIDMTYTWVENNDGSIDMTMEMPQSSKMVTHIESGSAAGTMTSYDWSTSQNDWYQSAVIIWTTSGSGSWTNYDEDGEEVSSYSWS